MILTLFESVQRAYTRPEQIIDADWADIAQFLMTRQEAKVKEDVPLFNLWQFKTSNCELGRKRIYEDQTPTENYEEIPNTIRRCKANAEAAWGIVLDFDGEARISQACEDFSKFTFALYTTFRHTPETHKFRVVFPFGSAVDRETLQRKKSSIQATFQSVDNASFSESQCFYLHSGSKEHAFTYCNKGEFLDPAWFEDEVAPTMPTLGKVKGEFTGDKNVYKDMLIDSLATCSGLHYANERSKHGVLTLVALCKSAAMSYDEYNIVCWNMAAPDSSLQDESFRRSAWMGWSPFGGITAKVREEFIAAYGGLSKFNKQAAINRIEQDIEKLKGQLVWNK